MKSNEFRRKQTNKPPHRYIFHFHHSQTSRHVVGSGIVHTSRRRAVTTARTRSVVHSMRGSAGPLPRSAPGRPSLTHRSTSWSAASTHSGTFQVLNEPIWRRPWNSRRPRWKSGSRTADIKPNGARCRASWRRATHHRKQQWKYWWGTIERSTPRWTEHTSRWLCHCTMPTSTTPPWTTAAGPAEWAGWRVEGCCVDDSCLTQFYRMSNWTITDSFFFFSVDSFFFFGVFFKGRFNIHYQKNTNES